MSIVEETMTPSRNVLLTRETLNYYDTSQNTDLHRVTMGMGLALSNFVEVFLTFFGFSSRYPPSTCDVKSQSEIS